MKVMTYIIWTIILLWLFWGGFVLTFHLKLVRRKNGRLTWGQRILGAPYVFIFFPVDVIIEKTLANLIFLDLSEDLTVSSRLERYTKSSGWRRSVAVFIRQEFLADFDPTGGHG